MGFHLNSTDFWYRNIPGSMLLKMEQNLLKKIISHVYGDYLVQLGGPSDLSLVESSPVRYKYYLGQQHKFEDNDSKIFADINELPFLPESLDVAVLAHVLEFSKNPREIISQIYEALIPNGYCIIFGFNFWSLWNFAKLYNRDEFPWGGHFFTTHRIKHWLRAEQFSIVTSKTACFRPPIQNRRWLKSLLFMEPVGQLCLPGLGGFYMIMAQKYMYDVIPVQEQFGWKKYGLESNGYVKPSTRNI